MPIIVSINQLTDTAVPDFATACRLFKGYTALTMPPELEHLLKRLDIIEAQCGECFIKAYHASKSMEHGQAVWTNDT